MAPRMKKKLTNSSTHDLEKTTKKTSFFKQRFPGFKKKATELSVLCGNSVVFICYGPNNDSLHVWPENPQTLEKIVSQFDAQSDLKKKKNASDLRDFPRFDGLSVEELNTHLSDIESHLVGVTQKKLEILTKTIKASSSSKDRRPRVEDLNPKSVSEEDHLNKVSDEKLDTTKLGFGGVFDELGYVIGGSTTTSVSDFEPKTLMVPKDDGALLGTEAEDYYIPLDPLTLGFESQLYPIPETYDNLPMGIWDMDLPSTLASDSFMMTNTCQRSITDNWGNVLQGFHTQQPFHMWESQPLL